MTIQVPPISEIGALVQAFSHRKLATAFLRGEGLISAGDLAVTGDPSVMNLNFAQGGAFLQLPDSSYDVFWSSAAETRTIATPPVSGSRVDLVYLGLKSKEFGDSVNTFDIYIKPGSTGSGLPPAPDVMAATYTLGNLLVPSTATKGSDCTFTSAAATTAPLRDGGYTSGDIVSSPGNYCQMIRAASQSLLTASISGSNFDTTAWTQVNWDTVAKNVFDPGLSMPDTALNRMLAPVDGYVSGAVTITFPAITSPAGIRGVRVRTIVGSLVGQHIETADNFGFLPARLTVAYETPVGAGHDLIVEVIQTQGSTLTLPASAGYDQTSWSQRLVHNDEG